MMKVSKGTVCPPPPNPDPLRFAIKRTQGYGLLTVALIHYPDATTYGGDKVLVFKLTESQLRSLRAIDPHFTGINPEPLARFRGDKRGWQLACAFVEHIVDTDF